MFELYVHISYLFDILRFDLAAGSCMYCVWNKSTARTELKRESENIMAKKNLS